MKYAIYFLLGIILYSCATIKNDANKDYKQRDIDLTGAIEYIQHDNKDCNGDCVFRVSGVFEYFDNCLVELAPEYIKTFGIDIKQKFRYFPENIEIKNFGRIYFTKPDDNIDYYFSPVIYNATNNSLLGHVKTKEKESFRYSLTILLGKFYFASENQYPSNCYW